MGVRRVVSSQNPWDTGRLCGCWYLLPKPNADTRAQRSYLPLEGMKTHTVIKDIASRTVLTQTFSNKSGKHLKDARYSFPLYDGVSVVSFSATVGDVTIHGVVKEKQQARREYRDAVEKGSSAGLLEQLPAASDVFVTSIGNVPVGAKVTVEIVYIGELKHDAQYNGTRFTIPTSIAPRYGTTPSDISTSSGLSETAAIQVTVDFRSPEGCPIQQIQSPSHPIAISVGRTSDMPIAAYMINCGSATLGLNDTSLDKDFVVIMNVKDADRPKALLETHPTIKNQRALVATLVPRFNLPPAFGEIVFVVDQSGSMDGKMDLVIRAMSILLKSLPVGTKFNICSFGTHCSFLWPRSKSYDDTNLEEALKHVEQFDSNFGGTDMYKPVKATLSQRFSDMHLDTIILTDGEIWNQDSLFDMIREASEDNKCRFFSLGIGSGASTALVEGIATAGRGFSQFVAEGEKMDKKMVRLLKGALTPHINDYSLEIKYRQDDDGFEMVDSVKAASEVSATLSPTSTRPTTLKAPLSFFDNEINDDGDDEMTGASTKAGGDKFAHLPAISTPSILQAPSQIPPLYPSSRTTVYLLLDPSTYHKTPEAIILRASCSQGPIELEIKIEDVGKGETIHQLAAKRAVSEMEKSGGWLALAGDKADGVPIKNKYEGRWEELVEREAVRLGMKYQIVGKWCSFVAIEGDVDHEADKSRETGASRSQLVQAGLESSEDEMEEASAPPPQPLANLFQAPPGASHRQRAAPGAVSFGASTGGSLFGNSQSASPLFGSPPGGSRAVPQMQSMTRTFGQPAPPPPPPAARKKEAKRKSVSAAFGLAAPLFGSFGSAPTSSSSTTSSSTAPQAVTKSRSLFSRSTALSPDLRRSELQPQSQSQPQLVDRQPQIRNDDDKMHELIRLQKSDGSWEWNQSLTDLLGVTGVSSEKQGSVVATALAVAFLQSRMAHEADTWELIVEKAKNWLARQDGVDVEKEISDAQSLLG